MMRLILFLTLAAAAFGQNDDQTLTITMTRNVTATPDQVVFNVSVIAPPDKTLTDVVGLLTGAGLTAADLSYVSGGEAVDWVFGLNAPFPKMKETVATLAATAQRIASQKAGASMKFSVSSQRTSAEAQEAACPLTTLLSDARREADRIATAAGVRLGRIVGLSKGLGTPASVSAVLTANARVGDFFGGFISTSSFAVSVPAVNPPSSCSMVVQFALL